MQTKSFIHKTKKDKEYVRTIKNLGESLEHMVRLRLLPQCADAVLPCRMDLIAACQGRRIRAPLPPMKRLTCACIHLSGRAGSRGSRASRRVGDISSK